MMRPSAVPSAGREDHARDDGFTDSLVRKAKHVKASVEAAAAALAQHESSMAMFQYMRTLAKCKLDSMSLENDLTRATFDSADAAR